MISLQNEQIITNSLSQNISRLFVFHSGNIPSHTRHNNSHIQINAILRYIEFVFGSHLTIQLQIHICTFDWEVYAVILRAEENLDGLKFNLCQFLTYYICFFYCPIIEYAEILSIIFGTIDFYDIVRRYQHWRSGSQGT